MITNWSVLLPQNWLDIVALCWMLLLWVVHVRLSSRRARQGRSLLGALITFRRRWMESMLTRDMRMTDAQILNLYDRNSVFFASNALIFSAGILTGIANHEVALEIVNRLPLTLEHSFGDFMFKLLVLLFIFIYSFFAFTWAVRQYSFVGHIIAGAPQLAEHEFASEHAREFIRHSAELIGRAAMHYNRGMHCFYFGLATVSWFVHPLVFMLCSSLVLLMLIRREFYSRAMRSLISAQKALRALEQQRPRRHPAADSASAKADPSPQPSAPGTDGL